MEKTGPTPVEDSKQGFLLEDKEMEQKIANCLEQFFKDNKPQAEKPFFKNETKISVYDELFIFTTSFRYENERIVFDWKSEA